MSDTSSDKTSNKNASWKYFLVPAVIVIALWLFTLASFTILPNYFAVNVGDRGSFGDMFGGLNALFTGLAFAGVIYTMILQPEDLKQQSKELELTRQVLEKQQLEMIHQTTTMAVQRFESSFFSLLEFFGAVVEQVKSSPTYGDGFKGREALTHHFTMLKSKFSGGRSGAYVHIFNTYADQHRSTLGRYASTLENLFNFIQNAEVPNKILYARILESALSTSERAFLYYLCEFDNSIENTFKDNIQRLGILRRLEPDDLFEKTHAQKSEEFSGLSAYK